MSSSTNIPARLTDIHLPANPTGVLVIFPHAGARAIAFQRWRATFQNSPIALVVAQLPPQNALDSAGFLRDWQALLAYFLPELLALPARRIAFYGQSFGGLIAYQYALQLQAHQPQRLHWFGVAASPAPHLSTVEKLWSQAGDTELSQFLSGLGGTPALLLQDPYTRAQILSRVRADYYLKESYPLQFDLGRRTSLACPLYCWADQDDPLATAEQAAAWQEYTTANFHFSQTNRQGHFFPLLNREFPRQLFDALFPSLVS